MKSSQCVWLFVAALTLLLGTSSAASTCRTDLATAANITIFPTHALKCMNSKFSPDNSANVFLVWSLKDTTTGFVSIVVSAPLAAQQWAGLGFSGPGQMPGSTAMIATLTARGAVSVQQYFLGDRMASEVVRVDNKIHFTAGPESYYDSKYGIVYMAFQIDFNASKAEPNFLLFAQGTTSGPQSDLDYHTAQNYLKSDFAEGSVGESAASKLERKVRAHGAVQVFGWGVLLPIGAMVARYCRDFDPAWFYIHVTFQMIGFIFIIAGVATGFDIAKSIDVPGLDGHRGFGIFIFTLAVLQVLAVVARPHKDAKVRKYWNWYHHWVGRLALFFAAINIFLGLSLDKGSPGGGHTLKVGYIVLLTFVLVAFAILEALYWLRWNRTPTPRTSTGTSIGWNRASIDKY